MAKTKPTTTRKGQWIKNIGLSCLFIGFALEMGALATNNQVLLKTGVIVFLTGIPVLITGRLVNRRQR